MCKLCEFAAVFGLLSHPLVRTEFAVHHGLGGMRQWDLSDWDPQCTTKPPTLADVADYLESHGLIDVTFICHEVSTGSAEDADGARDDQEHREVLLRAFPLL